MHSYFLKFKFRVLKLATSFSVQRYLQNISVTFNVLGLVPWSQSQKGVGAQVRVLRGHIIIYYASCLYLYMAQIHGSRVVVPAIFYLVGWRNSGTDGRTDKRTEFWRQ